MSVVARTTSQVSTQTVTCLSRARQISTTMRLSVHRGRTARKSQITMITTTGADGPRDTTHLTSFDIPYLALQKAKYVVDTDLGGMAYWSIDSDWSVKHQESAESSSSTKHHLSRRNKWQNGHVSSGSSPSVERRRDMHEDRRAINVTTTVSAAVTHTPCDPQYTSGKVNGIDISIGQ